MTSTESASCNVATIVESYPWLYDRQRQAIQHLLHDGPDTEAGGIVWWRVGAGKTRVALGLYRVLETLAPTGKPLTAIVGPKSFYDWEKEADIASVKIQLISAGKLAGEDYIASSNFVLAHNTRILVFDEGWMYKNCKSNRAKAANRIAQQVPCLTLSGSMMTAHNLDDLFGQAYTVNQHRRIAQNHTVFRERYTYSFNDLGFPQHTPRKGSHRRIMELLAPVSDVYFPRNDQRRIVDSTITVPPTPIQIAAFDELRTTYGLMDADLLLKNAPSLLIKIQQISNGWVKNDNGDYIHYESEKLHKTWAICQELLSAGERPVIWCAFKHDVARLAAMAPVATLQFTSEKPFDIAAWVGRKANVAIGTAASGSAVNHFAQCPYAIYFSHSVKWREMQQSRGRTDRVSSAHSTCYYYYLHTAESMDAQILRYARQAASHEAGLISWTEALHNFLRRKTG